MKRKPISRRPPRREDRIANRKLPGRKFSLPEIIQGNPGSANPFGPGDIRRLWIGVFLVVFTVAAYLPVRHCDFVNYDDTGYVTVNGRVQNGLSVDNVKWAFTTFSAANWHPLTWISHMADMHFFGLNPAAHHLSSVFFHCINVLLLFLVLRRMTGAVWKSAAVAALFALHPQNVESVAWISERKNLLSTLFWLATMWSYVSYARMPSARRYLEVVMMMALGLMAKPMLVTLPFVLLLLDFWPLGQVQGLTSGRVPAGPGEPRYAPPRPIAVLLLEKVPLLALSVASALITLRAQENGQAIASLSAVPLAVRLENVVTSYAIYLYRMVWPVRLAIIYPFRIQGMAALQVAVSAVALVLITAWAVWRLRRQPYLAVGWFWFLGTLVPVIGLVQIGMQANADRYAYVPLIGIFIALAWAIGDWVERFPQARNLVAAATVACLLLLGLRTRDQIRYWHDSKALFNHAIDVVHDNFVAYNNLGQTVEIEGHYDQAYALYAKALQLKPNILYSSTLFNVGSLKLTEKKYNEAVGYFEDALRYPEGFRSTLITHQTLGAAYQAEHDYKHAEEHFREVMRLAPERAGNTRLNLAIMLAMRGRYDDAIVLYRENLAASEEPWTYFLLASAQEKTEDFVEAEKSLRSALRMKPNNIQYQKELQKVIVREAAKKSAAQN